MKWKHSPKPRITRFKFLKPHFFLYTTILCALVTTRAAQSGIIEFGKGANPEFKDFYCRGVEIAAGKDNSRIVRLKKTGYAANHRLRPCNLPDMPMTGWPSKDGILYLDFDADSPAGLIDGYYHHRVRSADYLVSSRAVRGKAAYFTQPGHKVVLDVAPNSYFGRDGRFGGSFSFDFWLYLSRPTGYAELFTKISRLGGIETGFRLRIENRRLAFVAKRFFGLRRPDLTGSEIAPVDYKPISLQGRSPIRSRRWYHMTVAFNHSTGRLVILQNGQEAATTYMTDTGSRTGNVYMPYIRPGDVSPLIIGENYFGVLDEIRFTDSYVVSDSGLNHKVTASPYAPAKINYDLMTVRHQPGLLVSPVISTKYSHPYFENLRWKVNRPQGTVAYVEVRTSTQKFDPLTPPARLPWRRVSQNEKNLPSHQFIQWRAILKADPTGKSTPVFHWAELRLEEDRPPRAPYGLRVVDEFCRGGNIGIEWDKNPEADVRSGGGYIIYYGFRPGEYLGKIHLQLNAAGNLEPITPGSAAVVHKVNTAARAEASGEVNRRYQQPTWLVTKRLLTEKEGRQIKTNRLLRERLRNKLRLIFNNELIRKHIAETGENLPFIQTDSPVYISLTAYDRRWWAGDRGHESKYAPEVVATSAAAPGFSFINQQ